MPLEMPNVQVRQTANVVVQARTGLLPVRVQDGDYPYLNTQIRADVMGIPETRTNPISPLQMLSATNMIADGSRKVRSIWPIGRAKRTREGMALIGQGTQMVYQPVGYGSRLQ